MATVEATAAAKVFFEVHFNNLLGDSASARSLHRLKMDTILESDANLTASQRCKVRQAWIAMESNHLRQLRKQRTRSLSGQATTSVSIAGYEVIRVLGKGSFGVVKLVQERQQSSQSCNASRNRFTNDGTMLSPCSARQSECNNNTVQPQVYAMKVIRKSNMLRQSQDGHIRAERDLLIASSADESKWIVPLIASFQDKSNLYLVLEYQPGGDFLGFLMREDILEEDVARWYIAEMVLCVEETHKLGWIHRDVKPDNFLITATGHLKISDFGLAFDGHWSHNQAYHNEQRQSLLEKLGVIVKGDDQDVVKDMQDANAQRLGMAFRKGIGLPASKETASDQRSSEKLLQWRDRSGNRKLARSIVGTSQYMAPEIIKGELYDGRCDWWSVGIILYEVGSTVFASICLY